MGGGSIHSKAGGDMAQALQGSRCLPKVGGIMREYGQEVVTPKTGAFETFSTTRRATMRCGQCGVPLNGSDFADGHYCDDRVNGDEMD